jgi:hypothetical protein
VRYVNARLVAALALSVAAAVGCTDGEPTPTSSSSTSPEGVVQSLSSYDDIAELHAKLVEEGIECGLEYEGLEDEGKEVSICVIEGEQALLTVWSDPTLVSDFVLSETGRTDTVAAGRNWTVDVDTGPTARLVADALGGILPPDLAG